MSLILDEHREYLKDPIRLEAFRAALRERVKPGDVVVDLGSGTGVLGLLACQAGASRVYAIEATNMIDVARRVAAANGFADRIVYVNRYSTLAELPERADGLVMDQIGQFGFEAGMFELMEDARRFLKPTAWTIPEALELSVAPIADSELRGWVDFWAQPIGGLDFSPARTWAANTGYPQTIEPNQLLGAAVPAARVAAADMSSRRLRMDATLTIERPGTLDAIGGWFRAQLAPGVTLSNAPGAHPRLARRNVVLPLDRAVPVQPGDSLDVHMQVLPADTLLTWRAVVRTADGETSFSHSTLHGMLLTSAELRRLRPDQAPRLTERGLARRSVLELCDGARPLEEIEREVFARHRALFRSTTDAAVFVSEVVSRYAE